MAGQGRAARGLDPLAWAAGAYVAACGLWLCARRGTWYDEQWTMWFTDPHVPLAVLAPRWLTDVHPPLYYLVNRLLAPLTGGSLVLGRMANLLFLLPLLAAWPAVRRWGEARFTRPFLLLVAAAPFTLAYLAEFRSYFAQVAAVAALVLLLRCLDRPAAARDRAWWAALACALALGCNLHLAATMIVGALVAAAALRLLRDGRGRVAAGLLALAAACCLPMAAATLAMARHAPLASPNHTGPLAAVAKLAVVVASSLASPALLAALALAARRPAPPPGGARGFAPVLLLALALAAAALWLLNLATHFLVPRYAVGLVPIVVGLGVEWTRARWTRPGWSAALAAGAALVATVVAVGVARNARWETNAPLIAALVRACPATRVLALDATMLGPGGDQARRVPFAGAVMAAGYRAVGRAHGFAVEFVAARPAAPRPATGCPTVVWVEQNFYGLPDAAGLAARAGVPLDPARAGRVSFRTAYSRDLLVVDPPGR